MSGFANELYQALHNNDETLVRQAIDKLKQSHEIAEKINDRSVFITPVTEDVDIVEAYTPLMWAAVYNRADLIREFLDLGADPTATFDQNKPNALVIAAENNYVECVTALIAWEIAHGKERREYINAASETAKPESKKIIDSYIGSHMKPSPLAHAFSAIANAFSSVGAKPAKGHGGGAELPKDADSTTPLLPKGPHKP